ncbi:Retrotransposable element Tf2 protein [Rhizoctonia solani]|uniref:Retrotransposable element Tf2 protein n=1 Tax=Rhizoctonia solani TaxID=456999 RepID=A0A8H8SV49_9AGAM|nr:Retrotransposable element Tf2 protein [Rhizoctonia solani]QRW17773.1 Retrotransposable element Tf2 protein [Rhizoctonia solani]
MLLKSAAPKFLWNEALAYACYLKNQVPMQVHGTFWKTLFEAFWGQKPNVSILQPWGTKCYVLDQGENQSKLDSKTFMATFVGISDVQGKSWHYYKTRANWILHSCNILFPKDHAAIEDVADNTNWGELVAPPAEGEMTQTNSAAEQPTKPTGTGGAHVLEPLFPPASPELGKVSLERVIHLLWGLQSQVNCIKRTLLEQVEISQEVCTNVKNISQAVDVVKDGLAQLQLPQGPHTPEDQKPPAVKETPRAVPKVKPIGKTQPFLGAPAPIIPTGAPKCNPLTFFNPYPSSSFPSGPAPAAPQGPPPAPVITPALPPAPSTVKVDHPDAFKGKIGLEAKQWLTRMLAWVRLNQRQFPSDLEVLSFLLMNMEEAAGAWAHPHLDQLGSHCALIQTVDEFKNKFLAAFGNPDATRAAEQKITSLTQTGTCAKYITKFCTLQMELNWNNAALCGQFAQGLHWEVRKQIATRERQPRTLRELQDTSLIIDNALREERASHPQQGNKSGKSSTTPNRGQVPANRPPEPAPSLPIPTTSQRKNATAAAQKVFATGWKATPKEDKGKAKETAKIGKDSEYQSGKEISPLFTISIKPKKQADPLEVLIDSGATSSFLHPQTAKALHLPLIDLPSPRTVTMLNGLSPQAGKIWKKAVLTFSFDGKRMTKTFLICNTGSHAAILGLKWLDAHNPEIDWNLRHRPCYRILTSQKPHRPSKEPSKITKWRQAYSSIKDALWFQM